MCAKALPGLTVKEDSKVSETWIKREIINKMNERSKWKNVNKEERREYYKQVRNKLKEP